MGAFLAMAAIGAGTSILGGLLGARGEKKAGAAREAAIREGQRQFDLQADRAEGAVNTGTDTALGHVEPYARDGQRGFQLYLDAIGVNGREAQTAYHQGFQDDPGFQAALDAGANQIEHSNIFRGRGDSGAAMKELYQFGERERLGAFNSRLDRLSQLSDLGFKAGTTMGTMEMGRGSALADIAMTRGKTARDSAMGIGASQSQSILGTTQKYMDMIKGIGSSATIGTGQLDGGKTLTSVFTPKAGATTTLLK